MSELPDTLSALIRVAVRDTKRGSRDPGVVLDMSEWVAGRGGACAACMAGCVMLYSLGVSVGVRAVPWGRGHYTSKKLEAIDMVRRGAVFEALRDIGLVNEVRDLSESQIMAVGRASREIRSNPSPTVDSAARPSAYLRAADILESVGL